ncbi:hypothetical protein PLICRDRAFT_109758 [Plicaturopsis crispa FD-325 SS-3]|nr:hypothetical protein PLICRDRAFT_109758 [Plicaturopsis crispa FD-325 SS-3]
MSGIAAAPATPSKPVDEYRLPTNVKPTHYDVTVRTDLEKFTFDGFVKIRQVARVLDILEETSTIAFNSSELDLGQASIFSDALKKDQLQSQRVIDGERSTLHFPTPLPAGSKAELQVGYKGILSGSMMGYYKASWEHEGKKKYYALTQFEPTAARRAFPSWDEPLLKATFAITMISRADTTNLSNMDVASETAYDPDATSDADIQKFLPSLSADVKSSGDAWKITKFNTTPLMSSYIVAFANGHFEYLKSSYKSPISGKTRPLRIYATSDSIHQAQFALDVKRRVLPLYEQVFETEYPLPKLDTLVAHDFDAGAMENWGLITGRTSVFLLDPKNADLAAKKRVATVQSHEVAHMWFGNITTMEWWNYLYLNEGFATLVQMIHLPADGIFPEWRLDSDFITAHLNDALSLDAKPSSHPIEVDCPDADQINQIFDSLSYAKAGSVLRMLSNYVGEERFLKGVAIYLKNHLYANSVTSDLWKGIGEATGIDVNVIMENWITKIGFPVITVTETEEGIHIRQNRFLETGPAPQEDDQTIWYVPLSLLTVDSDGKASVDKTAVLNEREKTIVLDKSKPFKLNAGTSGVYRVLYSPERLASIAEEASKGESIFSLNDRIGLVHDAMALAKAGFAKVSSALNIINILKNEKEFLVWDGIRQNLSELISVWWEQPRALELLNALRRDLYKPLVDQLGYEYSDADSPDTTALRTLAIGQAAAAKEPSVVQELKSRFAHYLETGDDSKIPADLQRIVFATAVAHGGRKEYDFVKQIHEKPKTPTQRTAAIIAMGASEDLEFAKETLDYMVTKARDQDVTSFFVALAINFKTRRLLVKFFMENYDSLYKRFEGNFTLRMLIERSMQPFTSQTDLEEFKAFFKARLSPSPGNFDKDTSKYSLGLHQTLDTIHAQAAWIERSSADVLEWLEKWAQQSKL